MGKETGFLEIERKDRTYDDPKDRLKHYKEFVIPHSEDGLRNQAARCMNCGIPYCHNGCPVNNIIPDWNHLVYEDDWKNALAVLHSTNNFPEFTGRVCPAPCEAACTLNIVDSPVAIKSIECAIIDRGFEEGWVKPELPERRSGKSVAVVGSGPAGLAYEVDPGSIVHVGDVYMCAYACTVSVEDPAGLVSATHAGMAKCTFAPDHTLAAVHLRFDAATVHATLRDLESAPAPPPS